MNNLHQLKISFKNFLKFFLGGGKKYGILLLNRNSYIQKFETFFLTNFIYQLNLLRRKIKKVPYNKLNLTWSIHQLKTIVYL